MENPWKAARGDAKSLKSRSEAIPRFDRVRACLDFRASMVRRTDESLRNFGNFINGVAFKSLFGF